MKVMTKLVTMVDPPSGWKFGFPKVVPDNFEVLNWEQKKDWLVSEGYPRKLIDDLGNNFWSRYWQEEIEIPPHTD